MTAEKLLELYYTQRPTLVWRIGKGRINEIRKLKDFAQRYVMNVSSSQAHLFGHPIELVEGDELRLITIGGNRE